MNIFVVNEVRSFFVVDFETIKKVNYLNNNENVVDKKVNN